LNLKQSFNYIKNALRTKKVFTKEDFQAGNILAYNYNAKDKTQVYDKTPLVLILKRDSKHTLAINFHWAPPSLRTSLIQLIISSNRNNIKKNLPLEFNYKELKPFIKRIGYTPIIRKYINSRISKKGVKFPSSEFMNVAKLRTESFTGGKSPESLYKKALKKYRELKSKF